jgi:gamma-glutamyl:cysteine ligase YbdK (ATP-grasp superfamily)
MSAGYTPGPWRFEAGTKTIRSVPANYWIATVDSWDGSVNNQADGVLMAAAPDMAAVLRDIAALLRDLGTDGKLALRNAEDAYQMATAALAKAGV